MWQSLRSNKQILSLWTQDGGKKRSFLPEKLKKKDIKCLSFEQFAVKKRQERSTHFRTSTKTKVKTKDTEPFALINIGLMKYVSADTTTPVRA